MKNVSILKILLVLWVVALAGGAWYLYAVSKLPDPEKTVDATELEVLEEDSADNGSFITDPLKEDIDSGYLILVNKEKHLDRNYKPDDLTGIKYYASDRSSEGRYMRQKAAEAFHSLVEEAKEHGYTLVMTTAYRSYEFQSTLYNNYVARDGQAAADRYSAQPGKSEHQTGLAVDVSSPSVNYELTPRFGDTEEGKWLAENARLFGFIMRYPEGKEDITGYLYEPWHIRYVGFSAAGYIYENNITLEEYLQIVEREMEE
jgi:D-alanyl-D-alanine carboxypeptidase